MTEILEGRIVDDNTMTAFVAMYLGIISINVRQLRGAMSQLEFGAKVGLSRATVSRIETGQNFQIASLLRIAEVFGLTPYDFCMTEEQKAKLKHETELYKAAWEREIESRIEDRVVRRLGGGGAANQPAQKGGVGKKLI